MIKQLIIGAIAILLFVPISADAGLLDQDTKIWYCRQTGYLNHELHTFISEQWKDDLGNHYIQRQDAFEAYIKKLTKNKFRPSFEAKCRDYYTVEHANKHQKIEIETSEKI